MASRYLLESGGVPEAYLLEDGSGALLLEGIDPITGTGAISVPSGTVAGSGAEVFTATGAVTVPSGTVTGTGDHTESGPGEHTGTGAISVPSATVAGTGALVFTATGAVAVQTPTMVGAGQEILTADSVPLRVSGFGMFPMPYITRQRILFLSLRRYRLDF